MPEPLMFAVLLLLAGVVLLVAEFFLPTHGVVGVAGLVCVVASVVMCFRVDPRLGLGVMVGLIVASPFVAMGAVKVYPHTPIGRKMILTPVESAVRPAPVRLGQVGVTVSELRPMGVCDFGDERVEVSSEQGMIPPGTKVQVVAIADRRAVVRVAGPA